MKSVYRSPLRVYVILCALSLVGIWAGMGLPVSLYPNSSKPSIWACVGYDMAADSFYKNYGRDIENQLSQISTPDLAVEKSVANYDSSQVCYSVDFTWGSNDKLALREVRNVVLAAGAAMPLSSRQRTWVWSNTGESGYLEVSFFSAKRSLTDVYKTIEPILTPQFAKVLDAEGIGIYNPQQTQVLIELKPDAMAASGVLPSDVENAVRTSLESYGAGTISVGTQNLKVSFPRSVENVDQIKQISLLVGGNKRLLLGDLARVDFSIPVDSARVMKTSGSPSVILYADPKAGGNIKRMAEETLKIIEASAKQFPSDISYKVLVDPSEFIRSAVNNVEKEVFLAAFLAVVILFLFIGNLKNVITAAIEIPLSMVLAFIMMKISGMNLNLISLGGLALSAGMNVDASVVVMENIFRHFEDVTDDLDFEGRLDIVVKAVSEVKLSVIASTIASLVVFIPLAFTSQLTYAVLGDLAKAVVFSHGFSAIVALILVPTVRLQMMKHGTFKEKPALLEGWLKHLEDLYAQSLKYYLAKSRLRLWVHSGLAVVLVVLFVLVVPHLDKEIIGKPDTDWLILAMETRGNTLTKQMESQAEVIEAQLLDAFGKDVSYTITNIRNPNSARINLRLFDKSKVNEIWKKLEEKFPSTPFETYWVESYNPAELPIPNPPDFKLAIRGEDPEAMRITARDISNTLQEKKLWPNVSTQPGSGAYDNVVARIRPDQLALAGGMNIKFAKANIAQLVRVATAGSRIFDIDIGTDNYNIYMRYPEGFLNSVESLAAMPINIGDKIVPLKAIADVTRELSPPQLYHEGGQLVYYVTGKQGKGDEKKIPESLKQSKELIEHWWDKPHAVSEKSRPQIVVEDAQIELNQALRQLAGATSLSIGLIFITMLFQFGDIVSSLLVLVAIPLGFIGVLISLFVFHSTLSLNSVLGVILLNGISVANSIILVDFLNQAVRRGTPAREAAPEVGRRRLRPILMTSMTTALGMLPVALGIGEGGKILQPLGIAVVGGLGFSLAMTLFVVPALQVAYLERREKRRPSSQTLPLKKKEKFHENHL